MPVPSVRVSRSVPALVARTLLALGVAVSVTPEPTQAQASAAKPNADKPKADKAEKADKSPNPPLYRSEAPLEMTFTVNVRQLKRDRSADAPWRAATLSYKDSTGQQVTVPVRARTRGIWRLKHCDFPPVRIDVKDSDAKKTLLANAEEPKLVTFCRNSETYENYVLQELQLYRAYRLLTEASHKVRLVKLTYADSATGKAEATRWSFFIEDPKQVAQRLGGGIVKQKGATADDLEPATSAIAYTFQYMIGNTDFSFYGLHNGEILQLADGRVLPIPYDFDFAGAINATYATPDPSLSIKSVRDRLFRGYCAHGDAFPAVWEQFRSKRAAIEALYADAIGKLLPSATTANTLRYFNEFFGDIRTPEQGKRKLLADCLK
ncbi:MAG: hypothetical protein LCH84_00810 [Gemmatimonadetes bacterium]|nr:hypothetical protein [Gemmatimonadota bacterium]